MDTLIAFSETLTLTVENAQSGWTTIVRSKKNPFHWYAVPRVYESVEEAQSAAARIACYWFGEDLDPEFPGLVWYSRREPSVEGLADISELSRELQNGLLAAEAAA